MYISPRTSLQILVSIAAIEGCIQFYYSVYWGACMNLAIVLSGASCLYSKRKQLVKNCLITLYIWSTSAVVGLGLGFYFLLHGRELAKDWCLILFDEDECSSSYLVAVYKSIIFVGVVFALPFMYFAVKTVHVLYLEALNLNTDKKLD